VAERDDEDRPPIIVKGGSLIIQSGREGEPGKPWESAEGGFRQRHDEGKNLETYSVRFVGGSGSCASKFARTVRVTYQPDSGGRYVVTITRARNPVTGKHEPFVTPVGRLRIDNTLPNPSLILDGRRSTIVSVAIGSEVCREPSEAILESIGEDMAARKRRKIGFVAVGAALIAAAVWAWRRLRRDEESDQDTGIR
jgi:hypothetical protein